jgi:general secretion pathway protein E
MVTGDAERALIHERASEAELRAQALRAGMLPMRDDGERLVSAGRTSREELLRVTRE